MANDISIIIPCYNEQDRIMKTINQIVDMLPDWNLQIVVVNDGSTDLTKHRILEMIKLYPEIVTMVSYEHNVGKGYAVHSGFEVCKHKRRLIIDADLSVSPDYIDILQSHYRLSGQGIIKGQRVQKVKQPMFRLFVGKSWKLLVWMLTGLWMDTQCPFTLLINLPEKFYQDLKIHGFAFDVELIYKAQKKGYSVTKKNVIYNNTTDSKVTLRKTVEMFIDLFRIRLD